MTPTPENGPGLWRGPGYRAQGLRHAFMHWIPLLGFGVYLLAFWGALGGGIGLPHLFREDPSIRTRGSDAHWMSPVIWVGFGGVTRLASIFSTALFFDFVRGHGPQPTFRRHVECLVKEASPYLGLLVTAAVFPFGRLHVGLAHTATELLFGIAFGSAVVGVTLGMAHTAVPFAFDLARRVPLIRSLAALPGWLLDADPVRRSHATPFAIGLVFFQAVLATIWTLVPVSVAPASLALLFVWLHIAYTVIALARPAGRLVLVIGTATWLAICNREPYRQRFEGIDYSWGQPVSIRASVDPVTAFNAWRAGFAKRPRLVVFVASGGAYRAGFFTAGVLDRLPEPCRERLRLLTGASGGMVAAAHYAIDPKSKVWDRMLDDTKVGHARRLWVWGDSLSPVAQQMVRDVRSLFIPGPVTEDRGTVLEKGWPTLRAKTFADLRPAEEQGTAPSLVLTPMILETGQPMFITNLDVSDVKVDGYRVTRMFVEWPEALERMPVATAVRMNASFPYISPAVELPTLGVPLRIVDAGYFDNYGVSAAVAILGTDRMRRWLRENTSGLVFVHVRASVAPSAKAPGLGRVPHFLTSPVEGLLTAQEAAMLVRNEVELNLLASAISALPAPPGEPPTYYLKSFPMILHEEAAMSWYVTENDRATLEDAAKTRIAENLKGLTAACEGTGI